MVSLTRQEQAMKIMEWVKDWNLKNPYEKSKAHLEKFRKDLKKFMTEGEGKDFDNLLKFHYLSI